MREEKAHTLAPEANIPLGSHWVRVRANVPLTICASEKRKTHRTRQDAKGRARHSVRAAERSGVGSISNPRKINQRTRSYFLAPRGPHFAKRTSLLRKLTHGPLGKALGRRK